MKINAMQKVNIVLVVVLLLVLAIMFVENFVQQYRADMRHLAWYESHYLLETGCTKTDSFSLYSLDGGKTWYDATRTIGGTVIINGPAEKIRPGLRAELAATRALHERATRGPLDLSDPKDLKLLEGAGFTTSRK